MNNKKSIPTLAEKNDGSNDDNDLLTILAKEDVDKGFYPDIDTAKDAILDSFTKRYQRFNISDRLKELKPLVYNVVSDGNINHMKSIPKVCEVILYSDKLGQPFFFDVFRHIVFEPDFEIVGTEPYIELAKYMAEELVFGGAIEEYIKHVPEFQKFVSLFLDQRTTKDESWVAWLSTDPEYEDIYDEFDPTFEKV